MSKKRAVRQKQTVSIYTLAKEFDVTPGTVSRALRNRPEIGTATRTFIRKRAEELGFKLRNFESRLTNICVVIETRPKQRSLFSAYVDSVLDGVWQYCSTNEIELSIFGENLERLESCNLVRVLGRRGANGAVFLNASLRSGYFASLNQQNFPYCCVMTAPPEARPWTILADASGMAERATQHLLQLGHQRIAFFDSLAGFGAGAERKAGYLRAMKAAARPERDCQIMSPEQCGVPPIDAFDFATRAVHALLGRPQAPTAFLTMNDEEGVATIHQLTTRGLRVPEDCSVISFDDSHFCAYSNPALTVISLPYQTIGEEAASIVHQRIQENSGDHLKPRTVRGGELLVRDSTGPAPSK
jgi:DNA-binding LacI/PurR family transcriptional regulator